MMQIALMSLGFMMVFFGAKSLATGEGMKLSKNRPLEGTPAKIAACVTIALGVVTFSFALFQDRVMAFLV